MALVDIARSHGSRYYHFWWATVIVSIVTEMICYLVPSLNNFWHAQGIIIFAGRRFPLYIVLVYNQFWYTAFVAASRAHLRWWAEPFATGLLVLLMDLPYDIMGVKMLWWTWHDTDPNIYDRHYYVPWTSYYFHSAFCAAICLLFFGLRRVFMPSKGKWESGNCFVEWLCTILAGVLAMPVGSAVFITLFYHTLHDVYGIHTEVSVIMWLVSIAFIVWLSDRNPSTNSRQNRPGLSWSLPLLNVVQYFTFFTILMFFAKPEKVKAIGLHQMIGPCNETEKSFTITGLTILREKNLCVDNYDEPFTLCGPALNPPAAGDEWYPICGLPYENPLEYKSYVWFSCALGLLVYAQFLIFSGKPPAAPRNQQPVNIKKTKQKSH